MQKTKLSNEQYYRSLDAKGYSHLWIYNKDVEARKKLSKDIFITRNTNDPIACIIVKQNTKIDDFDLCLMFGDKTYLGDLLTNEEKKEMSFDVFFLKN